MWIEDLARPRKGREVWLLVELSAWMKRRDRADRTRPDDANGDNATAQQRRARVCFVHAEVRGPCWNDRFDISPTD